MPFLTVDDTTGNCANNLAGLIYRHEDSHLVETFDKRLGG